MKRLLTLFALILFLVCLTAAQAIPPKREFRAVWIASVTNLDWPSTKFLSPSSQQTEYKSLLDKLKPLGINVVIVQIRPECDALYQSAIEPWSYWLTGTQGLAPNPLYDPLQFMIDETHKRGMEFHAWFNPYRAVKTVGAYSPSANHVSVLHPDWLLFYPNKTSPTEKLLDPGNPNVRNYVINVIVDVVRRYDIDGVHWDDYFYSYSGTTNQDSASWVNYHGDFTDQPSWRRFNVNELVRKVHDSISVIKPWVKFGISPFGISQNGVPAGISGLDAYSVLYDDPVTWMSEKWLDYLTPQLYWRFGGPQDYGILMPWWATVINGRHLYPGQAPWHIGDAQNWSSSELPNQIRLNRSVLSSPGSVFFRARYGVIDNLKGFADSLKNSLYSYPALIPRMPWKDSIPPLPPSNLTVTGNLSTATLHWQKPAPAADGDTARYFVVYRAVNDTVDMSDPRMIRFLSPNDTTQFVDAISPNLQYNYIVTAVDRLHNESAPAKVGYIVTGVGESIVGLPYEYRLDQNYPNPFNPRTTISFTLKQTGVTTLKVYDLLGREVATLVDGVTSTGNHSITFSGEQLSSGVYFYRVFSGSFVETKKMILQK
jgi:uncharacterized lipoprotein YddW (UPF0748 family)